MERVIYVEGSINDVRKELANNPDKKGILYLIPGYDVIRTDEDKKSYNLLGSVLIKSREDGELADEATIYCFTKDLRLSLPVLENTITKLLNSNDKLIDYDGVAIDNDSHLLDDGELEDFAWTILNKMGCNVFVCMSEDGEKKEKNKEKKKDKKKKDKKKDKKKKK